MSVHKTMNGIRPGIGPRTIDLRGFFDAPGQETRTVKIWQTVGTVPPQADVVPKERIPWSAGEQWGWKVRVGPFGHSQEQEDRLDDPASDDGDESMGIDDPASAATDNNNEDVENAPVSPQKMPIVSLNRASIEKVQRQKQSRRTERIERKSLQFFLLRILVAASRFCTLQIVLLHQRFERFSRKLENGWTDFETRFTADELYFLGISLPRTVQKTSDVLMYYPLCSLRTCAELLKIRKNHVEAYQKLYGKRSR